MGMLSLERGSCRKGSQMLRDGLFVMKAISREIDVPCFSSKLAQRPPQIDVDSKLERARRWLSESQSSSTPCSSNATIAVNSMALNDGISRLQLVMAKQQEHSSSSSVFVPIHIKTTDHSKFCKVLEFNLPFAIVLQNVSVQCSCMSTWQRTSSSEWGDRAMHHFQSSCCILANRARATCCFDGDDADEIDDTVKSDVQLLLLSTLVLKSLALAL